MMRSTSPKALFDISAEIENASFFQNIHNIRKILEAL